MKLKDIYELVITKGMEKDPRGAGVKKILEKTKKDYAELKDKDLKFFDKDSLLSPYNDTRILFGDDEEEIETVLVGIDMEIGEVLLADRLTEKGTKIDLIISHHPEGRALAALHKVMSMQEDILEQYGVPINIAEGIMSSRISEVQRGLMPLNHNRAVDVAKLFNIPFMCMHTPADNHVQEFLNCTFAEKNPETLHDVVDILRDIPEYEQATFMGAGPKIILGSEKKRTGKIFVDMTGGTSGSSKGFEKLAIAGVGTIVGMHMSEAHRKEAEKYHINVIIAGHMASDSLGMNLLLDHLEGKGLKIVPCSGLIRIKR